MHWAEGSAGDARVYTGRKVGSADRPRGREMTCSRLQVRRTRLLVVWPPGAIRVAKLNAAGCVIRELPIRLVGALAAAASTSHGLF